MRDYHTNFYQYNLILFGYNSNIILQATLALRIHSEYLFPNSSGIKIGPNAPPPQHLRKDWHSFFRVQLILIAEVRDLQEIFSSGNYSINNINDNYFNIK